MGNFIENKKNYSIISLGVKENPFLTYGCNAYVIGVQTDMYVYVVKSVADETLKECGVSLERYIEESKVFHLNIEYIGEEKIPDNIVQGLFSSKVIRESDNNGYLFRIPYDTEFRKKHYYSFAFLRKLYYEQYNYINYFRKVTDDMESLEKYHLLGAGGHDLFYSCCSVIKSDYYKFFTSYNNYHFNHTTIENTSVKYRTLLSKVFEGKMCLVKYKTDNEIIFFRRKFYVDTFNKELKAVGDLASLGYSKILIMDKPKEKMKKIKILSRHPSHKPLRELELKRKVLYRLGSVTPAKEEYQIYINSINSIENSKNKRLMKECFRDIPSPKFISSVENIGSLKFPLVAKHIYGSRGTGNYKLESKKDFDRFCKLRKNSIQNFIFEEYCTYVYEYRVHVSKLGVFLIWQKRMKRSTEPSKKWIFNNENCVFIGESNPSFIQINKDKLNKICLDALTSVGLDIGSVDIKVNKKGDMKIIEINSAPSLAEIGINHYKEEIKKLCAV